MLLVDAREYEKSIEEFAVGVVDCMQKHVPFVLNTLTEPVFVRTEVVCKAHSALRLLTLSLLWREWVQSCCR